MDQTESAAVSGTKTATATATVTRTVVRPKQPVPWNVVLIDDDHHSYDYVIRMVQQLFGHEVEKAYTVAKRVDTDGRAVCFTTHKELAELKRDQILGFGRDPIMAESKGSMTAVIEPAVFEGDDGKSGDNKKP